DFVHFRIERVPFAAIDSLVFGEGARGQVEFGIDGQQGKRGAFPGLVAEALKLWNEPDAVFFALGRELGRAFRRDRLMAGPQLGIGLKAEAVIDLKDYHIETHLRQLRNLAAERFKVLVRAEIIQVQPAPWSLLVRFLVNRVPRRQGQREQKQCKDRYHQNS